MAMETKEEDQKRRAINRVKNGTYVALNKITDNKTIDGLHSTIFGSKN